MSSLSLALYCEGTTDEHFLTLVIRRTARSILAQRERNFIEVLPVDVINVKASQRDECILAAAYAAVQYQVLLVHSDADHPTSEKALQERFYPGYELVQRCPDEVCRNLLSIIPVYMTEAWMLADHEALRDVIKTDLRSQELGLPRRARQVELDSNPKQTLKLVLQRAYAHKSRRRSHVDLRFLYEPLGRKISLERLSEVPAYRQFKEDLIATLKKLDLIP